MCFWGALNSSGREKAVEILLSAGANPNLKDELERTCLFHSINRIVSEAHPKSKEVPPPQKKSALVFLVFYFCLLSLFFAIDNSAHDYMPHIAWCKLECKLQEQKIEEKHK